MNSELFQIIWTVFAFVFFIAVVFWALSKRRKADFEAASRMALDDDEPVSKERSRGH